MNLIGYHQVYSLQSPCARSEGKLKAYESCYDVRSWSHDLRQRDRYLREWIKLDMPFCFIPISTLVDYFSAMSCRSRGRTTPRCHPDCKSRIVLESITTSCEAIRECLKADRNLNKFFCEEEFESSYWPCERCLEALKSIKMFWKILLEKIYAINLTKSKCYEDNICKGDSVKNVARHWQHDMVHQARFVKQLTPQLRRELDSCKKTCLKKANSFNCITSSLCQGDDTYGTMSSTRCPKKTVRIDSSCNDISTKPYKFPPRICRCVSAKVHTSDACCGNSFDSCQKELYRASIESLQRSNCSQRKEIERLKQENKKLRCELQNMTTCKWTSPMFCATAIPLKKDNAALVPKPFESCFEDDRSTKSSAKGAESELSIIMRKCKHEDFKHVSLLQVLHKTNDPWMQESYTNEPCYKDEDPVELLTKVQTTLGAIVKREMALAKMENKSGSESEIEASFQRCDGTF